MEEISIVKKARIIGDPRVQNRSSHLMVDIVVIAVIAILCGAESWNGIEEFGKSKKRFLSKLLQLPDGIPSHDTFNRVISSISPRSFQHFFTSWTNTIKDTRIKKDVIAIDGKTIRRSKDTFHNIPAVHIVSAWSNDNSLVLGQVKTEEKSNEITAIPELLKLLDIKDSLITIDAMGCQKEIAKQIVKSEGDYLLALKGNQQTIKEEVECAFAIRKIADSHQTIEKSHGRIETRKCEIIDNLKDISSKENWEELKTLVRIDATREINGIISNEVRFYISSLKASAEQFNTNVRKHWGVENSLHWVLDMTFGEDYCRKRNKYAAQNFAILEKMALNMLNKKKQKGMSLKTMRLKAAWDDEFLTKIIDI